ncbi:MAG: ECF transporter S component [Ruminococcaceae bacterium]|jgi:Putative regulator of cell autolysis|nr:ECF transporter S component [Oscillospiraceae bacterium]
MIEKKKHSIKEDFSTLALLTMPIAVAVNFVGSQIHHALSLPLFLDTIGTFFVSMLCGPWVGALTGLIGSLVNGITNPSGIPFALTSISVGLVAGFLARAKMFDTWWKIVISIALTSLVSTIVSAPIAVLVYGGVTSSTDSLFAATLMASGVNIWKAVIGTSLLFTCIDRVIAIVVTRLIIKVIPARNLIKYSLGNNYVKNSTSKTA